jgi:hypothetical protein
MGYLMAEQEGMLLPIEEELRKRNAILILLRLPRYVSGYLQDYDMDVRTDFDNNPLSITIRVYYKKEEKKKEA